MSLLTGRTVGYSTTSSSDFRAVAAVASDTSAVKRYLAGAQEGPLRTPAGVSFIPEGRSPSTSVQAYGLIPPVAIRLNENGLRAGACGRAVVVITRACLSTASVYDLTADRPLRSATRRANR